jgi:hypothetical protein
LYTALAADFDGDGKADPTVYNPATGDWKIRSSVANYQDITLSRFLGGPGFAAAGGDMDGDHYADPFVCNMETGECKALFSSALYKPFSTGPGFLGTPGCLLILADYDGDGKADPAVFNPWDSTLVIRPSSMLYYLLTLSRFLDPNSR